MRKLRSAVWTLVVIGVGLPCFADRTLQVSIGPRWPAELNGAAWDASIGGGILIDRKVGIGGIFDFVWHNKVTERKIENRINAFHIEQQTRMFMFPISGYLSISPLPDLIISPVGWGQVGFNTMYFSKVKDSLSTMSDSVQRADANGWYMGVLWKAGADALLKIGDNSGFYAGVEYMWTRPSKLGIEQDNIENRFDMSGIGVRMGFRIAY